MPTTLSPAPAKPLPSQPASRTLTGRMVFVWFVVFFGIVFAVNFFMAREALTTFAGIDTPNPYKAGLAFGRDIAAARAQAMRDWQVEADIGTLAEGRVTVTILARDEQGQPLSGLDARIRLDHPARAQLDRTAILQPAGTGRYRGTVAAMPGAWDLVVDLKRGGGDLFRSRNRIIVK